MRIALLADIHANKTALDAVLSHCRNLKVKKYWFLGDLIGRGPDPIEVVQWAQTLDKEFGPNCWVMGNHDAMLANLLTTEQWQNVNDIPKTTIKKHRELLMGNEETRAFILERFTANQYKPKVHSLNGVNYILVHGGLKDPPGFYRYLYPWYVDVFAEEEFVNIDARKNGRVRSSVMFFGHTHVPTMISGIEKSNSFEIQSKKITPGKEYILDQTKYWLINPGSVGQPRDMDNRAAYAVLDTRIHKIVFYRIPYDWHSVQKRLVHGDYDDSYEKHIRDATPDTKTPQEWLDHYRRSSEMDGT